MSTDMNHSGGPETNTFEAFGASEQEVDRWLASTFSLSFDPFRELNAAEDLHLHEYMVGHETFSAVYGDDVSFVFAPAGGGKSAFRARLARACRVGEGGRRLFPVVYMLPPAAILASPKERWPAHEAAILQAIASELLLRVAYRPHEFDQLSLEDRGRLRVLLEQWLPSPLEHLLAQVDGPESLVQVARGYDPSARWPNPPDSATVMRFRELLMITPARDDWRTDLRSWSACVRLVLETMRFEAIYLLLDGVDAYPETLNQPGKTWEVLQPILDRMDAWADSRVFLKAFLPAEMADSVTQPPLTGRVKGVTIRWTPDMLRLVLQRRIEAASGMAPSGLSALGDPELFDLEEQVVEAVRPYPRDVVRVVERMFLEHVRRRGPVDRLELEDVRAALDWYKRSDPTAATRE